MDRNGNSQNSVSMAPEQSSEGAGVVELDALALVLVAGGYIGETEKNLRKIG